MNALIEIVLILVILVALAWPLGKYIARVMRGDRVFLSPVAGPCERFVYRIAGIDTEHEMDWKRYALCVVLFSVVLFVFLVLVEMLQGVLPLNPQGLSGMRWDTAINTAVSFLTNTNWQSYSGEAGVTPLTQMIGLTVANFLSAAIGMSVLFALVRGISRVCMKKLGNFWVDLTRSVLYVLLPLSFVVALLLAGGGVVENLNASTEAKLVEPAAYTQSGERIEDAVIDTATNTVTVDGKTVDDAVIVTDEYLPQGLIASQEAIKQIGSNGGGYTLANSANPYENPSPFTNLVEMVSILLVPVSLCFAFGEMIEDRRQGRAIFLAMFILLALALVGVSLSEWNGSEALSQGGLITSSGNLLGKDVRFGVTDSSVWSVFTTAASNGSVNASQESLTPLASLITMLLMQLGEVVFGGVGCGLYTMLAFVILTVFIAGLMVGRTPEFLGKKIRPFEMKWAVVVCLSAPIMILAGSALAALIPGVRASLSAGGAQGFTEFLYAFTSTGANNGSGFAGFGANTVFLNLLLAAVMLLSRYLPMIGTLAIAGGMAGERRMVKSAGTLSTSGPLFIFLLIVILLLIGALSFFPSLALGPIAEFFTRAVM